MSTLHDYTEDLRWLQSCAKEQADADPKRYKGVNFFQGLWGYKEVALFLGIAAKDGIGPRLSPPTSGYRALAGGGERGKDGSTGAPLEPSCGDRLPRGPRDGCAESAPAPATAPATAYAVDL
jgi:hypothetical protein